MTTWKKTRFVGVRYRESKTRKHKGKPEKYYSIRYKSHGQTVEESIGWESEDTGNITPQYCSNLRGQIIHNIRTGEGFGSMREKRRLDEAKKKAEESKAITLDQAFEDFKTVRTLKKTTLREYERSMNTAFADWKGRKVMDISRHAVGSRHQKLKNDAQKNFLKKYKEKGRVPGEKEVKKRGGAQANLHMRFLRSLLNFCAGYYEDGQGKPLLTHNPVKKLSETKAWNPVPRRKTTIKTDKLPAWFQAVQDLENEVIKDYLIFLALTGSRKGEGLTLEIEQVDLINRTYTLLDPKNREDCTLPLSNYLFTVLDKRIKKLKGFEYVFPGIDKKGNLIPETHLKEPKYQVKKVIKASGAKFSLHDLRRQFVTAADDLDLSPYVIKRLINHSSQDDSKDPTPGYISSGIERLRKPMQKIEDRILRLARVAEPGKVVKLRATS